MEIETANQTVIHAPSRRARKANRRVDGGSGGSEATFGPSDVETGEKTGDMARTIGLHEWQRQRDVRDPPTPNFQVLPRGLPIRYCYVQGAVAAASGSGRRSKAQ